MTNKLPVSYPDDGINKRFWKIIHEEFPETTEARYFRPLLPETTTHKLGEVASKEVISEPTLRQTLRKLRKFKNLPPKHKDTEPPTL